MRVAISYGSELRATAINARMAEWLDAEFVWLLTGAIPTQEMELALLVPFVNAKAGAVQPSLGHGRASMPLKEEQFIEFKGPMIRQECWKDVGPLDTGLTCFGFDLDWSYRARQKGWKLYTDHTLILDFSQDALVECPGGERADERYLIRKYGKGWLSLLWPTHPNLINGKETVFL